MKCSRLVCERVSWRQDLCKPHWQLAIAQGIHGFTDATPAREHVAKLRDLQWSFIGIAAASGVSAHVLGTIHTRTQMQRATERAILAVPLELFTSYKVTTSIVGLSRRREALACLGWPLGIVAPMAGTTAQAVCNALTRGRVTVRLHNLFADMYDEVQHYEGPSKSTATHARKQRWGSPMAWEFADIDDPNAKPFQGFREAA